MRKKIIAVIGDGKIEAEGLKYKTAFALGKALADNGYRIQSGGLAGVMEAVFQGAQSSEHYTEGGTIAILPSFDDKQANKYADIVIPTGLDVMRNALVANADACIAIGGGAGTLCEMALAWSLARLIIAYKNMPGWSSRLADSRIDDKIRYDFEDDRVFGVESAEEVIALLEQKLPLYSRRHDRIVPKY